MRPLSGEERKLDFVMTKGGIHPEQSGDYCPDLIQARCEQLYVLFQEQSVLDELRRGRRNGRSAVAFFWIAFSQRYARMWLC